jgi:hypothetical protein
MMQITIFISLLFVVGLIRILPTELRRLAKKNRDKNYLWFGLFIAIGGMFVLPMILNWHLDFLFNLTLNYWSAFAIIFVINAFTMQPNEGGK